MSALSSKNQKECTHQEHAAWTFLYETGQTPGCCSLQQAQARNKSSNLKNLEKLVKIFIWNQGAMDFQRD